MDRSVTLSSPHQLRYLYKEGRREGGKEGKRGEVKGREGRQGGDWWGGGIGSEAKGEGVSELRRKEKVTGCQLFGGQKQHIFTQV